jgi:hypothetical protein
MAGSLKESSTRQMAAQQRHSNNMTVVVQLGARADQVEDKK